MSGICGIVNFDGKPVDPELLKKMAEAAAYRGPDGISYWVKDNVGLAHLALHTTPESVREQQPLINQRGDLVLTTDARVDNRDELIRTLTTKGYLQEKDPTDADLIMAAYECWEDKCSEHIIGDSAFAVWDSRQRQLLCARDATGIRPFHYSLDGPVFRFGSDISQVLADERVKRDLDGYTISDFLVLNFRDQARTVFAGVHKLLPGHCLALNTDGPRCWRYWNPDRNSPIRYSTDAEYIEHFRELLFRCVSDRLRSAKSAVAIEVSGGVDSSSIAAVAQSLFAGGHTRTQPVGYTYVFDTLTECDEREYSLALEAETGLELHKVYPERFFILDDESAYAPRLDTPLLVNESLLGHTFQQAQGRGCDAVMTGHGGDALFGPAKLQYYDDTRSGRWWRLQPWFVDGRQRGRSWRSLIYRFILWPLLPKRVQYLIDQWRGTWRFGRVPVWIHARLREKTRPARRLYQQGYPRKSRSCIRQMQYEHLIGLRLQTTVTSVYNVRAHEHRMEARFPFLDRRLVDFVLAVPVRLGALPSPENTKWILRQSIANVLPEKIRLRSNKADWSSYNKHIICKQARQGISDLFVHSQMDRYQLVDEQALREAFATSCEDANPCYVPSRFLLPMCLERWLRTYTPSHALVRFNQLQPWQSE